MAKWLCITGMVIAILIFVLFLLDLLIPLVGLGAYAPFKGASMLMDIAFTICAGLLAYLSWSTLKQQS